MFIILEVVGKSRINIIMTFIRFISLADGSEKSELCIETSLS